MKLQEDQASSRVPTRMSRHLKVGARNADDKTGRTSRHLVAVPDNVDSNHRFHPSSVWPWEDSPRGPTSLGYAFAIAIYVGLSLVFVGGMHNFTHQVVGRDNTRMRRLNLSVVSPVRLTDDRSPRFIDNTALSRPALTVD